jgi:hypothetical protein
MDPRWLEILKAGAWQLLALCIAFSAFWAFLHFGILPPINSVWVVYGVPLAALICGALAFAAVLDSGVGSLKKWRIEQNSRKSLQGKVKAEILRFTQYIPHLTQTEFEILAFLFQNEQRTFTANITGDRASSLYSQGFIKLVSQPGQQISALSATFQIPDTVWEAMNANSDTFSNPKIGLGYKNQRPWHSSYF